MRGLSTEIVAVLAVVVCSVTTASAQSDWDPRQYLEDVRRAGELTDEAEALPASAVDRRDHLLQQSLDHRAASVRMLRSALLSGELNVQGEAFLERARGDLYLGYQNLVWLHLSLGQCGLGRVAFDEAYSEERILPSTGTPELDAMALEIHTCDVGLAQGAGEEMGFDVEGRALELAALMDVVQPPDAGDGSLSGFQKALPWILTGTGAACLIAGVAIDLANAGDLDEFEQIRDDCDAGRTCNATRGQELQSSLDSAKVIEGVLIGVGAAAAISGIVVFIIQPSDDDESNERLVIEPHFGRTSAGITIGGRF